MPDLPANASTSASVGVNDSYSNTLEVYGDTDWVAIELNAGQTVQINLDGSGNNGLADPVLSVFDDSGSLVAFNDDVSFGVVNSELVFTASSSGTYYVEAAAYNNDYTGDYTISVEEQATPSPTDSLVWGTSVPSGPVTVYFAPSGETFDGYTSEGFNSYERGQFLEVFDMLSDLTDLEFEIVTNSSQADLILVLDTNEINGQFLGYFNPPGTTNEGVGVFDGTLWDRSAGGDLDRGGFGYVTIVHELLHGLGMAHPHDNGGTSTVMSGVTAAFDDYGTSNLNQGIFTIMTYNSGYWTGTDGSAPENPSGGNYGFEGGPMALDIAVLQELYGANTTFASGNNTYTLVTENQAGTFWEALWDTGGNDTIRHNGQDSATIDLRAATLETENGGGGFVSAVDGVQGGYTIANGVVIENAIGGHGDDTLIGNDSANEIEGRAGADNIRGGRGADKIRGGLDDDRIQGQGGSDNIRGGSGSDVLDGNGSSDIIRGGSGSDRINGGGSGDRLLGGSGRDEIRGATGADNIKGGSGNDALLGGRGSDDLNGGSGRDVLTGGTGSDTFIFVSASHTGVGAHDTITDMQRGSDVIDLSGIDANTTRSGNQTFEYIGTDSFDAAGQVRIVRDGTDLYVQGDRNGDGNADFEILVEDTSNLTSSDFIL